MTDIDRDRLRARMTFPALLAENDALRTRLAAAEAAHTRVQYGMTQCCEQCSWIPAGRFVRWPCPTTAALQAAEQPQSIPTEPGSEVDKAEVRAWVANYAAVNGLKPEPLMTVAQHVWIEGRSKLRAALTPVEQPAPEDDEYVPRCAACENPGYFPMCCEAHQAHMCASCTTTNHFPAPEVTQ